MIARKPSIFIYTNNPNQECLKEICAGIEEEGVFFEISEQNMTDAEILATDAAAESMLGSGIGICGDLVVLQMKGLPKGKAVARYNMPDVAECRAAGANSARIIKKLPLKIK